MFACLSELSIDSLTCDVVNQPGSTGIENFVDDLEFPSSGSNFPGSLQ